MNSFTGFTLDHYTKVFGDTRLMIFILNTFILALLSALLATAIGTLGAIMIYYLRHSLQSLGHSIRFLQCSLGSHCL